MYKVLLAEDEVKMREIYSKFLMSQGIDVIGVGNGLDAVNVAHEVDFDLIILDVMMPVMNGIDACQRIRKESNVPIVFLSCLGEEEDMLTGLDVGADDYITKPTSLPVLAKKCKAKIDRYRAGFRNDYLSAGGIKVDLSSERVFVDGVEVEIVGKTYKILVLLMKNKGRVLSRNSILDHVWDISEEPLERAVDTHIKQLRKCLGTRKSCIVTKFNSGYVFREDR